MINCYDFDYVQYRNYSFKIYDISLNELCTKVIITSKDCCASGLNEDVMSNSRDIEDCLKGISVVEI